MGDVEGAPVEAAPANTPDSALTSSAQATDMDSSSNGVEAISVVESVVAPAVVESVPANGIGVGEVADEESSSSSTDSQLKAKKEKSRKKSDSLKKDSFAAGESVSHSSSKSKKPSGIAAILGATKKAKPQPRNSTGPFDRIAAESQPNFFASAGSSHHFPALQPATQYGILAPSFHQAGQAIVINPYNGQPVGIVTPCPQRSLPSPAPVALPTQPRAADMLLPAAPSSCAPSVASVSAATSAAAARFGCNQPIACVQPSQNVTQPFAMAPLPQPTALPGQVVGQAPLFGAPSLFPTYQSAIPQAVGYLPNGALVYRTPQGALVAFEVQQQQASPFAPAFSVVSSAPSTPSVCQPSTAALFVDNDTVTASVGKLPVDSPIVAASSLAARVHAQPACSGEGGEADADSAPHFLATEKELALAATESAAEEAADTTDMPRLVLGPHDCVTSDVDIRALFMEEVAKNTFRKQCVWNHCIEGFVIQESLQPFPVTSYPFEDFIPPEAFQAFQHDSPDSSRPPHLQPEPESEEVVVEEVTPTEENAVQQQSAPSSTDNCVECGKVLLHRCKDSSVHCSRKCYRETRRASGNRTRAPSTSASEHSLASPPPAKTPRLDVSTPAEPPPPSTSRSAEQSPTTPLSPSPLKSSTKQLAEWTTEDVCSWLLSLDGGFDSIADLFRQQEIDGNALGLLEEDLMVKSLGIKLGPAIKICAARKKLQRSCARAPNFF